MFRTYLQFTFALCFVGFQSFEMVLADEASPLDWLPNTTALYAKVEPTELLLDHPLRRQIESLPVVKQVWQGDELKAARVGITSFELITATPIETVARKLTDGGVHVAVDAQSQGAVLFAKTESEKWLKQYVKRLLLLARNDAKTKQKPDPIKETVYEGIQGYEYQSNIVALMGPWLMITNKPSLAKSVVDRYTKTKEDSKDNSHPESLRASPQYKSWQELAAKSNRNDQNKLASLFLNLDTLRAAGAAKELLQEKTRDFGGELTLGGILSILNKTSLAFGELATSENGLCLHMSVPNDPHWANEAHEFYAGPQFTGTAPKLLALEGAIGRLSTYRDLSQLWLRSGDLFDQKVNDELAQADNTLTTLFSGKDFGEDILGGIEPQLQIVVAPQIANEGNQRPAVQLPSFALCGTMKSPALLQRDLRRVYQNAIGFLNIVGAMEGNPQLDMQSEKIPSSESEFYWAEYVPDSDKQYANGLPIQFNFQPCLAFHRDKIIVASHVQLARQIVANNNGTPKSDEQDTRHTLFSLDGTALTTILRTNREQLISNNVLEKGHTRKQAEGEVDILLRLLELVREFQGSIDFKPHAASLSLQLDVNATLNDSK